MLCTINVEKIKPPLLHMRKPIVLWCALFKNFLRSPDSHVRTKVGVFGKNGGDETTLEFEEMC